MCLSDGNNNAGSVPAPAALQSLFDLGAVCDCIIVGDRPDQDLLRVVAATNGQCDAPSARARRLCFTYYMHTPCNHLYAAIGFRITNLAEGFETLESGARMHASSHPPGPHTSLPIPTTPTTHRLRGVLVGAAEL